MFALQDEPEKGHRLAIFAVGAVLAVALQGGGIWAASSYTPKEKPKDKFVTFSLVEKKPEPPKAEPPPPEPPKPEPPPPEPPKVEPPKPKLETKPKPKLETKPKPEPPRSEPPPAEPPKNEPPPVTGLSANSATTKGAGPVFQMGNTQMGESSRTAVAPQTGKVGPARPIAEPEAPPAPPPKPVLKPAKLVHTFKPAYTREALRAGIEGSVVAVLTIDASGQVIAVKIVKGLGFGLDEVAEEAFKRWRFEPATSDGRPIQSTKRESIGFVLED